MNNSLKWLDESVKIINSKFTQKAQEHQNNLTKPPGSLGELENIAIKFSAWQESDRPNLEKIQIYIFAADHGIARENVSAFPQAVTAEMVRNFAASGAAIAVLAKFSAIPLKVLNMGTVSAIEALPSVEDCRLGAGTESFLTAQAMNSEQLTAALEKGKQQAELAKNQNIQLIIAGEMGIANTTSAAAIAAALFNLSAADIAGKGTGLDQQGLLHKIQIIDKALEFHQNSEASTLNILQTFGGFEIAAMTGCYVRAAQLGIPILVDGFISTVAAALAIKINPKVQQWMLFAHRSAEQGHQLLLELIQAEPLMSLNLRLGEGSAAALVVPILRSACAIHNQMATFEQAKVSKA